MNPKSPFDTAIARSRQKFAVALQSALRFSDAFTLASMREVGMSCLPSAVAHLPPLLPNVRWVQRAALADYSANSNVSTKAPTSRVAGDPCAQAWLAMLQCQERAVAEFHGVGTDFATLVEECWPSLQRLAAEGDAEAALRLGVLLDPTGPRGWSTAGEAARALAAKIPATNANAAATRTTSSVMMSTTAHPDTPIEIPELDSSGSSHCARRASINVTARNTSSEVGASRLSLENASISKRSAAKLDIAAAEFWLRRAADAGSAEACHRLSLLLWQRRKADKGNGRGRAAMRATSVIAGSSSGGSGAAYGAEALRLLRRAANGGCSSALLLIASKGAQDEHASSSIAEVTGKSGNFCIADAVDRLGDATALGIKADDAVARSDFSGALSLSLRAAAAVAGPSVPNLRRRVCFRSGNTTSVRSTLASTSSAAASTATSLQCFTGGDCLCTEADACSCLPGVALSRVGQAAILRLADFFHLIDSSSSAKTLWLQKEGVDQAATKRLALLWATRADSGNAQKYNGNSRNSKNGNKEGNSPSDKNVKGCAGHALGSPPSRELEAESASDGSLPASTNKEGTISPSAAPWSVADIVRLHERNAGRPLAEIASCGNYFNLLKIGLHAKDVPATMTAFVLARQVSKVAFAQTVAGIGELDQDDSDYSVTSSSSRSGGTSRLGLSHNNALGAEGAISLADYFMQSQGYKDSEDITFVPVPGQRRENANECSKDCMVGSSTDITLHLEQAPREPIGSWLNELFMSDCNVGPLGAKALAAALPFCIMLEKLGLNYNNLSDDGAVALLDAITECARARKIASSSLSSTGLQTQRLGLHTLGLIGNGLTDRTAFAAAACLCGRSQGDNTGSSSAGNQRPNTGGQKPRQSIVLPHSNSEGAELISVSKIDAINDSSSDFSDEDSNTETLTSLCPLKRLYFNENAIGNDGASALAGALQEAASWARRHRSKSCMQATADNCALHDSSGTEAQADQNDTEASGKHVQVSTARSSSSGGKDRKKGSDLAPSLCLERLGLSDNAIGTTGGVALLSALTHGQCSLDKLCCSDNRWDAPTQRALCSLPNVFAGSKVTRVRKGLMDACKS